MGTTRSMLHRRVPTALFVLLLIAVACSSEQTGNTAEHAAIGRHSASAPAAHPTISSVPLNLRALMRRVHFAFRKSGAAWVGGDSTFEARVDRHALRFTPTDSVHGTAAPLQVRTASVSREAKPALAPQPTLGKDGALEVARAAVTERLENNEHGLEQSWRFAARPAGTGDLVVRLAVSGEPYAGTTAGGIHFADAKSGLGVRYGHATWVDANGKRTAVKVGYAQGSIALRVPAGLVDASAYPAVLDPTVSPEFGMDTPVEIAAPNDQTTPAVSFNGTNYLVAWADRRPGTLLWYIFATRVSQTGAVLDTSGIPVDSSDNNDTAPDIAFDGTNWLVVYLRGSGLYGVRVSAAGAVIDTNPIAIETAMSAYSPSVAFGTSEYMIVFSTTNAVYAHRLSTSGIVQTSTPISISSAGNDPNIAFNGTDFLVAYHNTGGSGSGVSARLLSTAGVPSTGVSLPQAYGVAHRPGLATDGTNWLVAYPWASGCCADDWRIKAARVSSAGALLDSTPIDIADYYAASNSTYQYYPDEISVAYGGGAYTVLWDSYAKVIEAERVSVGGVPLTSPMSVIDAPNLQSFAAAAFDGTNFLVAARSYTASNGDIYVGRVSASLSILDSPAHLASLAGNMEQNASVAFNGTNYFVAWEDYRPGASSDIYGVRVSRTGTVLDDPALALSQAINSQTVPTVASNGTDYFVAWADARASSHIYGTRVTASGTVDDPLGLPISGSTGTQFQPAAASDGANYLVVWQDTRSGCCGLYGARVDPNGNVLDASGIPISTTNTAGPYGTAVAFNGTNYLVAWSNNDIWGTRVSTSGSVLDSPAVSISAVAGSEQNPSVASDGTNWMVVWNDASDIRGARVAANGTVTDALGFTVSNATNRQTVPAIAWDGTEYWAVWQDARAGSTQSDIYGTRITPTATVQDASGLAISTLTQNEQAPAISPGGPSEVLVAYHRYDPTQPNGATRVRARLVNNLASQGTACTLASECASNACVDGYCCDSPCTGVCQACSSAKKGGGLDGVCGNIKEGNDPDNECADQGSSTCGTNGTCNGAGACELYVAGTPCGGTCVGNSAQGKVCDGSGACTTGGTATDCSPYVCSAGACKNPCVTSADCVSGLVCSAGACISAVPLGGACTLGSDCASGFCADGVCCDTACTGTCMACTTSKKGQGSDGTCGPIVAGSDPDNECTQQAAGSCGTTGACSGSGTCQLYPSGTSCGSSTCQGNTVQGQVCDGNGSCIPTSGGVDCSPYVCSGGSCKNPCSSSSECVSGYQCVAGACKPLGSLGTTCTTGSGCQSGFCVDGVCCDTACTGLCMACSAAKKGQGGDGTCGPIGAGTDPDNECAAQAKSTCGQDGMCDGAGACGKWAQGTECLAAVCAGTSVTTASQCDGSGTCVAGTVQQCVPGYKCVGGGCATSCTDNTSCDIGYTCDTSFGGCVPASGTGGSSGAGGSAGASTGGSAGVGGAAGGTGGTGGTDAGTGGSGAIAGAGGSSGNGAGGYAGASGSAGSSSSGKKGGCGCREAPRDGSAPFAWLFLVGVVPAARRRRRKARRRRARAPQV